MLESAAMRMVRMARTRARHERPNCRWYCKRRSKAHGGRGKAAETCNGGLVEGKGAWEWEDGRRGVFAVIGDGEDGGMTHAVVVRLFVGWVGVLVKRRREGKEA